jgi:hypothetical protein
VTPRRLIPKATVDDWDARLHAAATEAVTEMHSHVKTVLANHGVQLSALTAAGEAVNPWHVAAWALAVAAFVVPVADQIAAEAESAARDAVPAEATWGIPSSAPAISATLVASVTAAGNYLGGRLNANVSAAADPAQAADAVFSTADDILGGQLGAQAQMIANYATQDTSSFVAGALGTDSPDVTKTWSAVMDDRTREWHADLDGVEIPINATWQADGEDLLYPGDGGPSNSENCRCEQLTDGIDPGQAIFGPDEEQDALQGLEKTTIRAGRQTSAPVLPKSYPN